MSNKKLTFAVFGNQHQIDKLALMQNITECIESRGGVVVADSDLDLADVVVSVGGDGTFIRTATSVGRRQTPIMGVNVGRLGFLADVLPSELDAAFDSLFADDYRVEEHTMLQLSLDEDTISGTPFALNDIAVLKRDNASMISIRAHIGGEYLTTYQADGLIVSTPTGSTAYSLSNGGPIVLPDTPTLCLTPVAPHMLNSRPMVLSDNNIIRLEVESRTHNFLVAVDGRSYTVSDKVAVNVSKAPFKTRIIKHPFHQYLSSLRQKMMWGADNRC